MRDLYFEAFNSIKLGVSIGTMLLLGFSLVGENSHKIIKKLSYIALFMGIIFYAFHSFAVNAIFDCLLFVILIPILKLVLKLTYQSISVAVLMSLNFELIIQLMLRKAVSSFNNIYISLIEISVYVILGLVIYYKGINIFPKDWGKYCIVDENQRKKFNYYLILMLFVLVLMSFWSAYITNSINLYSSVQQYFIISFTIAFLILFIYFIKILISYAIERIEVIIDKQYQKELVNFMEIIRAQRHDFNFHLQAISGMIDNENYSECKKYISQMVGDTSKMNEVLPLYHPEVSALLNTFREIAARKKIQFQVIIYYNMEKIPCTVYEINKIIGNLIQNAIDEVEQNLNDYSCIQVTILKRSGNSVIKVSNKVNNNIDSLKKVFVSGYSTKFSHEGIGLNTVQKIASKYNGIVYPEIEGDMIHFIAQIPNRY
jgi:hypothetical protein